RRGPRQGRTHGYVGKVHGWKPIDAQTKVAGRADHHQRQDNHRGENRPTDADLCKLLHQLITITGWPPTRFPGCTMTPLPTAIPSVISTRSPNRRPVRTRFSTALLSVTIKTFSIPAKVMI